MNKNRIIPVCEPMLDGNEEKYVLDAVREGWISSSGDYVGKFEKSFAEYCGCRHAIAVTNGTVALHLALRSVGIGQGDEVIIPSFTMIASAFAVCYTGAVPVFVDSEKESWNIDVSAIEDKITCKTKAIMPVHIFGNPCDMNSIVSIADKHGLKIIEDCAESHGAEYKNQKVGCFSSVAAFSFFANKNLTTGEGGMCVTNDDSLDVACRYFKNMCFPINQSRNYQHNDIGYNYRMSNIHAAIGLAQVEKADHYRALRRRNHKIYEDRLASCSGIIFQKDTENALNVNWMNAIVIDKEIYGHSRDELMNELKKNGVETRLLFKNMNKQPSLRKYGCDCSGEYPVTDWLSENGMYLPSGSGLKNDQIEYICDVIIKYGKSA